MYIGHGGACNFLPFGHHDAEVDCTSALTLGDCEVDQQSFASLERRSYGREWNAPGVELPSLSLMRSKNHDYEEFGTFVDHLDSTSLSGLEECVHMDVHCVYVPETIRTLLARKMGESQLGRRNMHPHVSRPCISESVPLEIDASTYCADYQHLLFTSRVARVKFARAREIINDSLRHHFIDEVGQSNQVGATAVCTMSKVNVPAGNPDQHHCGRPAWRLRVPIAVRLGRISAWVSPKGLGATSEAYARMLWRSTSATQE